MLTDEAIRQGVGRGPTTSGGYFVMALSLYLFVFLLLLLYKPSTSSCHAVLQWSMPHCLRKEPEWRSWSANLIVYKYVLRSDKLCQSVRSHVCVHTVVLLCCCHCRRPFSLLSIQQLEREQNYFWQTIHWRTDWKCSKLSMQVVKWGILKWLHMCVRHISGLIGESLIPLWAEAAC